MASTFVGQVNAWVRKSENRMRAVVKESAQRVFNEAQRAGPSVANPSGGEGGKMPIDTGFLRASFSASFSGMPTGPGHGGNATYRYDDANVTMVLAGMQLGQTIYAGWTAQYAPIMELRYGFARSAAQQWPQIVSDVVKEAMVRYP